MDKYNIISAIGIFILIGVAWIFSTSKKDVNWRTVGFGVAIQTVFGFFIFIVPIGIKIFLFINDVVVKILDNASTGVRFVFGRLALSPGIVGDNGETSLGFILAFQGFPTIIFFSALMSVLYYLNILQWLIRFFARIFSSLMVISGAESLCTSSNIFCGVESALTIKPYLQSMTQSELCTILSAGMATLASNVLAVYIFMLRDQFPTIAGHLISASFIAAPAGVVMAKILMPETGIPVTLGKHINIYNEKDKSLFEAIINGSNEGIKLIIGIIALLIGTIGLVSMFDMFLGWIGQNINSIMGIHFEWTLKALLGYVFYPFTIIMGIPLADAGVISKIIGIRVILTEAASYQELAIVMSKKMLIYPRSAVIAAYALSGFAHIPSLAIFIGGTAALVPERTADLARIGFRALVAATLACFMTACIAGAFFIKGSVLISG
ncbi:MAG: nucleoside transporter [Nitrospirae bacterium]|nr:nucleoside transporter [Nitrospirota bacterium]